MDRNSSQRLGVDSIFSLLIRQGLPASIGILVMSLNILIDTIFVGRWIGSNAIAAINAFDQVCPSLGSHQQPNLHSANVTDAVRGISKT